MENKYITDRLISMVNYTIELEKKAIQKEFYKVNDFFIKEAMNYAKFLQQKPKLSDFIPCDEKGSVLQEPHEDDSTDSSGQTDWGEYYKLDTEYQKAVDRVLFEGWKITNNGSSGVAISNGGYTIKFWKDNEIGIEEGETTRLNNTDIKIKTYENLTKYNLKFK